MNLKRSGAWLTIIFFLSAVIPLSAQDVTKGQLPNINQQTNANQSSLNAQSNANLSRKSKRLVKRPVKRKIVPVVIPPVTVLNNPPEYLSGEANVNVAGNQNPIIRLGIAQNGVTLIEFPAGDKFYAVHPGNSDFVTVECRKKKDREASDEECTINRSDHHLVLRAGTGFAIPKGRDKFLSLPSASILVQMDSGMVITFMFYPVPLLKQQAHRVVVRYDQKAVLNARKDAGLAVNLTVDPADEKLKPQQQPEKPSLNETTASAEKTAQNISSVAQSVAVSNQVASQSNSQDGRVKTTDVSYQPTGQPQIEQRKRKDYSKYQTLAQDELNLAINNYKQFKKWSPIRHGLSLSIQPQRDMDVEHRLVIFAVKNNAPESVRIVQGFPDLIIETLGEKEQPVDASVRIVAVAKATNALTSLMQPGSVYLYALVYEAPILGAKQHLKIAVAQANAADEPAFVDLTATAR